MRYPAEEQAISIFLTPNSHTNPHKVKKNSQCGVNVLTYSQKPAQYHTIMPETKAQPWRAIWQPNKDIPADKEGFKRRHKMPGNMDAAHGFTDVEPHNTKDNEKTARDDSGSGEKK